ncbi:DEKNAAC100188 [Brettanomyces naardenensis]|uniref:DEKNAAC100188 n=1 Tax=Brettanomyces naardenensis TaxID=13370 RepID=A0A448YG89_BRENA|nr:DEKNAAC100188 [Brettanomyces naardenensis]
MPASASGTAFHKKKAGTISILEDVQPPKVVWKCIDSSVSHPLVEIPLDAIVNLQATPAATDKMMLKIGVKAEAKKLEGADTHNKASDVLFSFKNRETMDEIKLSLQQIIARKKSAKSIDESHPVAPVAAIATYSDNIGNDEMLANLLDSKNLLKNLTLQQKLLRENPDLMKTFTEAVIKCGLDPDEFWSTRVHLLRSYAIQHNQKRGPYNVLSTIKPVASSDNEVNVSVTREKIHEIFKQYPIVRKAYDDNVPKISEGEFWSRFFSSKLFRKLRGEKINLYDRGDITLDKYLYYDPDYDGEEEDEDVDKLLEDQEAKESEKHSKNNNYNKKKRRKSQSEQQLTASKKKVKLFRGEDEAISKCIDILGNQEDDPQLLGNAPDVTMKDKQDPDLVNVLRTMNRLSRRMLSNIKEDKPGSVLDDEFMEELQIRDLEEMENVEYNELKYTQRSNVSSNIVPSELLKKAMTQSDLNPEVNDYDEFMTTFKKQFHGEEKLDLTSVYFQIKKSIYDSYKDVTDIVKKNSKQSSQAWSSRNLDSLSTSDRKDARSGIPKDRLESLRLTHSTSIEFLRHFWLHFNSISMSSMSTNPNFKSELIQVRKCFFSITKCLERVNANLSKSEGSEREAEERIMKPLIESLKRALKCYEDAVIEPKH